MVVAAMPNNDGLGLGAVTITPFRARAYDESNVSNNCENIFFKKRTLIKTNSKVLVQAKRECQLCN